MEHARRKKKWIDRNPVADVDAPPVSPGRIRWLAQAERKRLLKACDASGNPDLGLVVRIALASGARQAEILHLLFTGWASATSYSTDQSDLWYIAAESGWGIQLVQRGNTIFFTMFVYDPAGKPIWYVGTILPNGTALTGAGDMYLTSGPWLGAQPYNSALFGGRIVGTMTWHPTSVTTGTLSYLVDGVAVTKNVVRQTLVNDNFSGHYAGGLHQDFTTCANPANIGTVEDAGILDITHRKRDHPQRNRISERGGLYIHWDIWTERTNGLHHGGDLSMQQRRVW